MITKEAVYCAFGKQQLNLLENIGLIAMTM